MLISGAVPGGGLQRDGGAARASRERQALVARRRRGAAALQRQRHPPLLRLVRLLAAQGEPSCDLKMTPCPCWNTAQRVAGRQVGFRHAVLVTGDDTDPAYVARAATEQGTELHGMFFRVNGAPIFARGANMIPMVSDAADRSGPSVSVV